MSPAAHARFEGNEENFLCAYGHAAEEGHTAVLKVIQAACKQYRGRGERHCITLDGTAVLDADHSVWKTSPHHRPARQDSDPQ